MEGRSSKTDAGVVHDTVGGKVFTECSSVARPYGDLASNVESLRSRKPVPDFTTATCGFRLRPDHAAA